MVLQLQELTITAPANAGSPWKNPSAWDTITVGGVTYGWGGAGSNPVLWGTKVRIEGAMRKYKLEVKGPQGADGAITTYRGVKLSPFHIVFYMYSDPQYEYFVSSVLPVLKTSGVKDAQNPSLVQSLAVYHPILANLDIGALLVEEIGGVDPKEDGPVEFTCKVRVVEYLPPPDVNVTVTPDGSISTNQATSAGTHSQNVKTKRAQAVAGLIVNVANSAPGAGP